MTHTFFAFWMYICRVAHRFSPLSARVLFQLAYLFSCFHCTWKCWRDDDQIKKWEEKWMNRHITFGFESLFLLSSLLLLIWWCCVCCIVWALLLLCQRDIAKGVAAVVIFLPLLLMMMMERRFWFHVHSLAEEGKGEGAIMMDFPRCYYLIMIMVKWTFTFFIQLLFNKHTNNKARKKYIRISDRFSYHSA